MEAIGMDIQLIIKAPNQNVEDHVVNCNLEWTVQKLKKHLATEYPSKPVAHNQKLIYSGRLLHDHLHLKDVLRHEDENSSVHILHLVCGGQNFFPNVPQNQESPCSSHNQHGRQSTVVDDTSGSSDCIPDINPETVLRQRTSQQTTQSFYNQQYYTHLENQSAIPYDAQLASQMATMQQIYSYYLSQYMHSVNCPANIIQQNFNAASNAPNEAPAQTPANANLRANAQGRHVEENDDFLNRDWLEQFFLYCRFFILFSIVYFYSSPERLMIAIVLALIAFLYHEGWFVRLQHTPGINTPIRRGSQNSGERNTNDPDETSDNQNLSANEEELQDPHELEAAMDGDEPPHVRNSATVNNTQSLSPWTLIAAFFSSLIPEPPPPVNIN